MKIRIPSLFSPSGSETAGDVIKGEKSVFDIPLSGDGDQASALVPRILPIDDPTKFIQDVVRVSVQLSRQTVKGGALRVLVKTNVPYTTLDPNAYANDKISLSAARSKHSITVHQVLTIPKECLEDIKMTKLGKDGIALATSQLAGAVGLQKLLCDCILTGNRPAQWVHGVRQALGAYGPDVRGAMLDTSSDERTITLMDPTGESALGHYTEAVSSDRTDPRSATGIYPNNLLPCGTDLVPGMEGVPGLDYLGLASGIMNYVGGPLFRSIMEERPLTADMILGLDPAGDLTKQTES